MATIENALFENKQQLSRDSPAEFQFECKTEPKGPADDDGKLSPGLQRPQNATDTDRSIE